MIEKMQIKNVIFDFGGVLMDWSPYYVYDDYFNSHAKAQDFINNICTPQWNATMDAGVPFAEATAKLIEIYPQYAKEINMYKDRWKDMLKGPIQAGVELLECISQSKLYDLYGLTNWSQETFPYTYDKYPFFSLFKGIIVSGEEKLIKPDPKIFKRLLEKYELNANECFFIDDNNDNIKAALDLGFNCYHLTDHKVDVDKIKQLLKLN